MSEVDPLPADPVDVLREDWAHLTDPERLERFRALKHEDGEELFLSLPAREQATLLEGFSRGERKVWIRFLAPDDATDVIQELPEELRPEILELVDATSRREITALLSYREDEAGGLMSPRFARVRPEMLVAEAIRYVRQQAQVVDPIHYIYVLDFNQRLLGVVSLRRLFVAPGDQKVSGIMETELVTVHEELDQESLSGLFQQHRWVALPVVDGEGRMQGVVTVDDILDVSQEEATEDIQKLGGTEALDAPYAETPLLQMIKKRAGWLMVLFVGEMFTTTAMSQFEDEIARAVVLAMFIPLIISAGGNAGSQASSLIIREIALRQLKLSDWFRVFTRELVTGLCLGTILGVIGFTRIMIWPNREHLYTQHYMLVAISVAVSVLGCVLYGSLVGSMLPFLLRRLKLDPASASAPMVATLVDVTGLVIYFEVAKLVLKGILL